MSRITGVPSSMIWCDAVAASSFSTRIGGMKPQSSVPAAMVDEPSELRQSSATNACRMPSLVPT